jgi:hypothetical protein
LSVSGKLTILALTQIGEFQPNKNTTPVIRILEYWFPPPVTNGTQPAVTDPIPPRFQAADEKAAQKLPGFSLA